MSLDLDHLTVESFATVSLTASLPGECCTGCDSGCGRNPTADPCQSGDANDAF